MNIEVVLTIDDPKLGKKGQVIKVSSGYARNCLFPQNKAQPATPATLKHYEALKARQAKEEAEKLAQARSLAERIAQAKVAIEATTGHSESKTENLSKEPEKIFGSVTSAEIAQALHVQGISIDKKEIHLEEPIKRLGEYHVKLKLHREVIADLKLLVVRKHV